MNKGVAGFLCLAAGGIVGFLVANKVLKDNYEQLVQDEVDSVKKAFKELAPNLTTDIAQKPKEPDTDERKEYASYAVKLGYISEEEAQKPIRGIHVIPPEEFGDLDEYDKVSLTYYADGTLADEKDRPMSAEDISETVGRDAVTHFGEYEDDSVFVRNDNLKADYEILADKRTYAELLKEKPYLVHM